MEDHLMADHVHMCLSIPPKCAVSSVVGFIRGMSAISIARNSVGRKRNFTGESFWARGYFVSTVGLEGPSGIHSASGEGGATSGAAEYAVGRQPPSGGP